MSDRVLQIRRFLGLNTSSDPRQLKPNTDNEGEANASICENMETDRDGYLITSKGFSEHSSIEDTGGVKNVLYYDRDFENKFLIVTHKNKHYKVTPTSTTWEELCVYGEEADFVHGSVYKGAGGFRKAILTNDNDENYPMKITIGSEQKTQTIQSIWSKDYIFNDEDLRYKQTFKFQGNYELRSIDLRCNVVGVEGFNINCDIYEVDDDNNIVGDSLASGVSRQSGAGSNYGTLTIDFDTTYTCTDFRKKYCFVLSGAGSTNYYIMLGSNGSTYNDGALYKSTDGGSSYSTINGDLYFELNFYSENEIEEIEESSLKGSLFSGEYLGHLFFGKGKSIYYSATEDENEYSQEDSGDAGYIGYNDEVTGFCAESSRAVIFTRTSNNGLVFNYDDNNALVLPVKEYTRKYGTLNTKSIQPIGSNTIYNAKLGVVSLGAEQRYYELGIPRPVTLSDPISDIFKNINSKVKNKISTCYSEVDEKIYIAVPYKTSLTNNAILVYDQRYKTWSTRTGLYPSTITNFVDEDDKDIVVFGDENSSKIYKFDDSYSYNGAGYIKKWKSKIFNFGSSVLFKRFKTIKIAGSMPFETTFYCSIRVDNVIKVYEVNNGFLLIDSRSDYIGDNILGDAYFGGASPDEAKFKRFYAPLEFSKDIREGLEMDIMFWNNEPDQPFKIDFLEITYEFLSPKQVPNRQYVDKQITT